MAYDTSKLINGTGIAALTNNSGKNFGFVTCKNGHLDGEYYLIDTLEEYALKGILRYQPDCMNYTRGFKVQYHNNTDTLTDILDSALFIELFKYSTDNIIKTETTLVPETISFVHPDLYLHLGDPAVVPIGKWQRLNLKRGFIFTEYEFDDCGNILLDRYFNPNGTLLIEHKYKSRPKKKKYWRSNANYEQD